jgi:hypothetical protein
MSSGRHGSEQQFQRYLHEPRGIHLAVDVSELRRTETQTWIAKSDAIQYVEELSAKLDVEAIIASETAIFEDSQVEIIGSMVANIG